MSETSRFIRPILKFLFPDAADFTLQLYHGYIRKFAHFFEYAVLAILASITFLRSTSPILGKYFWAAALLLIILVAASDEFNQSFNQLRTSSIWDVLLDAAGGVFGVAAVYLVVRVGRRRRAVP